MFCKARRAFAQRLQVSRYFDSTSLSFFIYDDYLSYEITTAFLRVNRHNLRFDVCYYCGVRFYKQ